MGLNVIAEGVESIEQESLIQAQGCDTMQGYLYSKPLPAQEMTQLLKKWSFHNSKMYPTI